MLSSINIGGKSLQLLTNAATPYIFKQTFKVDLMRVFAAASNKNMEEQAEITSIIPQLTYIMCKQAEGLKPSEFIKLKEEDFYVWLEDFGSMDFVYLAGDIINIYLGNQESSSDAKKKED